MNKLVPFRPGISAAYSGRASEVPGDPRYKMIRWDVSALPKGKVFADAAARLIARASEDAIAEQHGDQNIQSEAESRADILAARTLIALAHDRIERVEAQDRLIAGSALRRTGPQL